MQFGSLKTATLRWPLPRTVLIASASGSWSMDTGAVETDCDWSCPPWSALRCAILGPVTSRMLCVSNRRPKMKKRGLVAATYATLPLIQTS